MSYYDSEEIYDLEMENLKLKRQIKKLREALKFYATRTNWDPNYTDTFCYVKGWEMAQEYLKEIEG